jgi:DNA-binding beta-propeller fold protein YncE
VRQIGRPGMRRDPASPAAAPEWVAGNDDLEHFGRVAKVVVHGEVAYVADGYLNRRVAVLDLESGRIIRAWGAYGDTFAGPAASGPAAGEPSHFDNVHCVELSRDGLLYVCDRFHSRIQVFRTDGTFVTEGRVADPGIQTGAAWDIAFSPDDDQAFLYLADGRSMKIRVLRRDTLEEVTTFGAGGRQPGQFYGVHSLATDSAGNLYTTEAFEGKRVQRFLYRGLGPVTAADQGPPWPAAD